MYMKDSVNTLFQQRFRSHEAPVEPGVWTGIEQQLAATPAADGVNELFKDRFNGHEMNVDPAVWSGISSQIGHPVAAGTSAGIWAFVTAGVAAAVITAVAVFSGATEEPISLTTEQGTTAQPAPVTEGAAEPGPVVLAPIAKEVVTGPKKAVTTASREPKGPSREIQERSTPPPIELQTGTPDLDRHPTVPAGDRTPEPGTTVVSAIITDLEAQVKQQPITASPEPGLTGSTAAEAASTPANTGGDTELGTVDGEAVPMPKLFMPNTFTPNGDGINDTYSVDGEGYATILLRVYAMKSNALVFTTNSAEPWTGDGCEDGMYMVAVEARTPDGRTATEGKVVWLNRNRIN
ncbi:MAG: gliding motility-associated C-terminal domain-containing protein [Flavobacteriales bacterium]|nr:gliding motility-associated C-terminal domain-containing protein [Flavobacteriales bacterium]